MAYTDEICYFLYISALLNTLPMLDWIIAQFTISPDSLLIYGNYNYWLVALSVFIAMFAAFMGLQLASQAAKKFTFGRKHTILLVGSIALGGGIWTMHFIGMLAFDLCTPVTYGSLLTLFSLLPGICASWIALFYINNHRQGFIPLLLGGVLVGAGIGAMHYTGMAAMEMAPLLRYDPWMFALSIVVAVTLAMLSLWIRFGLVSFWKKGYKEWHINLGASIVMGFAIAGMHYTGMAAARFVKPPGLEISQQSSEISLYLALGVSTATIVIISLVLAVNLIYRYKDISQQASENERRLRAMMDTAVDGIVSIDSKGIIIGVNRSTEQLLGWSAAELIGNNVKMLMPEPFRSEHDGYLEHYQRTGEAKIIGTGREVEAAHKNGDRVAIRLAIGHVKMDWDDFYVAFVSDIRPRIKMERVLRENEEKFRSLISNIPGIAYRCKNAPEWPMIFINEAVENITGYPAQDFVIPEPKRSFSELYHPDDYQRIMENVGDSGAFNLEYRIIRRDGEVRWLMEQGTHVTDQQTGEVWLDGFIMDITERREMEQALREAKEKAEQAAAARAAFLANMSHEIRTPMNAIIGFSDILLDDHMSNEQQRHLKTINNSAKSLLHLLNDVLDSAKLDKGKLELELRDFSLVQEVDAIISTLWLQARNKGLQLTAEVSPKLEKSYFGSPERIRQVLTNLISNAVKFTLNGYIKLVVTPINNQQVEFVIEDTGIGMSDTQQASIFEAFTQADASMSRRFGGTGLGTTISKQLVELMGGSISVSSELDKGSVFKVILPLAASKKIELEQQQQTVHLPAMTILVVDDIQQNLDLLTVLLEREGHQVLTARDGQQALIRMSAEQEIDLVIMDIQMPVMDGLTACRQRRKIEQTDNLQYLPIIAFTASVLEEDRIAAKQAGMDGFANKPVDLYLLSAEIARILDIELTVNDRVTAPGAKLIDDKKGIALWGSKEIYYQELMSFITLNTRAVQQLAQYYQQQNWQELKALAHKYKGLCGNLALVRLMRDFARLESVLNSHPEQSGETISAVQATFRQVQLHVDDSQVVNSKRETESSDTPDLAELVKLLTQLKQTAAQNEIDEQALNLIAGYTGTEYDGEINAICQAFHEFEFVQAEQLIDRVLQQVPGC